MKILDRRSFIAQLGMTGLAASMLARGGSAQAPTDDLIWGVNGHPFQAYPGIPLETQLELVRELGFTHYRVGNRNNGLERLYPLAQKYGVTLLPIVHPDIDFRTHTDDEIFEHCFDRTRAVTAQHKGRFEVWELGNELENFAIIKACEMRDDGTQYPCEWGPADGVDRLAYYGPRWKKVSAAIAGMLEGAKKGDPDARRAIGTAGFGHLGAFDRWKEDGLDWDITVWHDQEQVRESFLEKLAGFGKPIWITEFNAGGGGFFSEEDNARMMSERIAYYRKMRKPYGVEAAFVYELLDETYWGDSYEARMGLYRLTGNTENGWRVGDIKPVGQAVKDALTGS